MKLSSKELRLMREARATRNAEQNAKQEVKMTQAFGPVCTCPKCLQEFRSHQEGGLCAECQNIERVSLLSTSYGQQPQVGDLAILHQNGRYTVYAYQFESWMYSTWFVNWHQVAELVTGYDMILGSNDRAFYRRNEQ